MKKSELKDIIKEYIETLNESTTKEWNTVAKMVSDMDGKNGVEDIGQKKEHGKKVHEFMIDNGTIFWVIEAN